MKYLFFVLCLAASAFANADIDFNISDNLNQPLYLQIHKSKIHLIGIEREGELSVGYVNNDTKGMVTFSREILEKIGFTPKEMIDLLLSFNKSESTMTLNIETTGFDVKEIGYISLGNKRD